MLHLSTYFIVYLRSLEFKAMERFDSRWRHAFHMHVDYRYSCFQLEDTIASGTRSPGIALILCYIHKAYSFTLPLSLIRPSRMHLTYECSKTIEHSDIYIGHLTQY